MGYSVGKSMVEEDMIELADTLMKKAEAKGVKLILPTDVVLADKFDNDANTAIASKCAKSGRLGFSKLPYSKNLLTNAFWNKTTTTEVSEIDGDWMGLDIGPETIEIFKKEIEAANTIVWNGPMGVFEMSNFALGTNTVAEMLAEATAKRNAITIIGGGDSVAAVNQVRSCSLLFQVWSFVFIHTHTLITGRPRRFCLTHLDWRRCQS